MIDYYPGPRKTNGQISSKVAFVNQMFTKVLISSVRQFCPVAVLLFKQFDAKLVYESLAPVGPASGEDLGSRSYLQTPRDAILRQNLRFLEFSPNTGFCGATARTYAGPQLRLQRNYGALPLHEPIYAHQWLFITRARGT